MEKIAALTARKNEYAFTRTQKTMLNRTTAFAFYDVNLEFVERFSDPSLREYYEKKT